MGAVAAGRLCSLVCAVQAMSGAAGRIGQAVEIAKNPIYHIVEEPGGIKHMVDCEVPPEEYYDELLKDMTIRHPKTNKHVLYHLQALEAFFDVSILAGFSFGAEKAQLLRTKATLLGNLVGRFGSTADPEKTEAIMKFDPLKVYSA